MTLASHIQPVPSLVPLIVPVSYHERAKLHKVILPIRVAVLVARGGEVVLGEDVVVGVVLLPLLFLVLLGFSGFFFSLFRGGSLALSFSLFFNPLAFVSWVLREGGVMKEVGRNGGGGGDRCGGRREIMGGRGCG